MMKMTSFTKKARIVGASIIGKSHLDSSVRNQDAFLIKRYRFGVVMCVCDGVGSNRFAHYGAKAACKAVSKVFRHHYYGKISKDQIGLNIDQYYKRNLRKKHRSEAATTCLFVFVYNDSKIIIGQAGDGAILIQINGKLIMFQSKQDEFMNEVIPLNGIHVYKSWKIKNLKFSSSTDTNLLFLLSTDGISEDILPNKWQAFMNHFLLLSEGIKPKQALYNELKNWSVPGSFDDKTVVTFSWRNNNELSCQR